MRHFKFALELCLAQSRAGRLFLLEHPAGAGSWSTETMMEIRNLEGVYMAKFDSCTLGMIKRKSSGDEAAARKRTTLLTNAANLAEML